MSDDVKYFNVRNISLRLVHIGGSMVAPEKVVKILDDEKGINRADVESSEFLEITEDEVTDEVVEVKTKTTVTKAKTTTKANTPTGTGWSK